MDMNSWRTSHDWAQSNVNNSAVDSLAIDHPVHAVCSLCQKILLPDTEATDDLESISICGDCKFLLLEDTDNTPSREPRQRRPPSRRRTRYSSSESMENIFSQQFSHMINLVRQNQPTVSGLEDLPVEGDQASRLVQRTSTRSTPNGSSRWRRVFSDTESDGFDNVDSVYGESESIFSFGRPRMFHGESDAVSYSTYGGDSDASVDLNGFLDPNEGSDYESDTDIDPMQAGLNHWNSDDQGEEEEAEEEGEEEEDGEWVEADVEEDPVRGTDSRARVRNFLFPSQIGERSYSPESVDMMRTRSIFANLEESVWVSDIGDPNDDLEARSLEEFLQHLLEESSRRGAPPAATSFVNSLPRVLINKEHLKHDGLACAICKDALAVGNEVNQLPCDHLYHPTCILPWLSSRNSCPLCRYELPTDDREYEEGKQRRSRGRVENRYVRPITNEDNSVTFSDREDDGEEDREFAEGGMEPREETLEVAEPAANGPDQDNRRGRWFFLAAAPIVGLVGIVLVLWLGNLGAERQGSAGQTVLQNPGQNHMHGAESASGRREGRSRRWWSFF